MVGGATVNAQGVVTSPNYRLKSGIFGTVGDALTGLDNNTLQWDSLKKAYSAAHGTDTTSTITNVKDGEIDTGVILDNAPYILMLAVVAGAAMTLAIKKRREEE